LGDDFLVKIHTANGQKENFDCKSVENDLKAAGLPERLAQEVAARIEARVEEGWTLDKVRLETGVELRRLQEDIDRAYLNLKGSGSMGVSNVGEERSLRTTEYSPDDHPRSENMVECRNVEN
jgi:hypothetical protein